MAVEVVCRVALVSGSLRHGSTNRAEGGRVDAGALPGALKNLLEWTVGDASTYRKPVAWINASGPAAPTGGAHAHDSLRKILSYVDADIVEDACVRIPLTREAVGADGRQDADGPTL